VLLGGVSHDAGTLAGGAWCSLVSRELARWWRRPTWTTLADRTRQEGEAAAHDIELEERRRRPDKAGRGGGCGRSGGSEPQGLGSVMGDRRPAARASLCPF